VELGATGWTSLANGDPAEALELWQRAWPEYSGGLPSGEMERRIAALASVVEAGHSSEDLDLRDVELDLTRLMQLRDGTVTQDEQLALVSSLGDKKTWRAVALNALTPAPVLAALHERGNYSLRGAVASNAALPVSLMERAVNDDEFLVRADAARNLAMPADLLSRLAHDFADGDDGAYVRMFVGSNPLLPIKDMSRLASDHDECEDGTVRSGVASNPGAPSDLLNQLLLEGGDDILVMALGNTAYDQDLLLHALRDRMAQPRGGYYEEQFAAELASRQGQSSAPNSEAPPTTEQEGTIWSALPLRDREARRELIRVAAESGDATACRAMADVCVVDGQRDEVLAWLIRAAGGPTPAERIEALLHQHDKEAWLALASDPSISVEVVRKVYEGVSSIEGLSWWQVYRTLGGNPAVPGDLLEKISQNWGENIPYAVGTNRMAPPELLMTLATSMEDDYDDDYPEDAAEDAAARAGAVENPGTPLEALEKALWDPDLDVRIALGGNLAAGAGIHMFFKDWAKRSDAATASRLNAAMAANLGTEEYIWRRIASGHDPRAHQALINNPAVPDELKAMARLASLADET